MDKNLQPERYLTMKVKELEDRASRPESFLIFWGEQRPSAVIPSETGQGTSRKARRGDAQMASKGKVSAKPELPLHCLAFSHACPSSLRTMLHKGTTTIVAPHKERLQISNTRPHVAVSGEKVK